MRTEASNPAQRSQSIQTLEKMMNLQLNEQYKFVKLQMAAEAFLLDENFEPRSGDALVTYLQLGNGHSSKFTHDEAVHFANHWRVVTQVEDETGFSGTLFECVLADPASGAVKHELSSHPKFIVNSLPKPLISD